MTWLSRCRGLLAATLSLFVLFACGEAAPPAPPPLPPAAPPAPAPAPPPPQPVDPLKDRVFAALRPGLVARELIGACVPGSSPTALSERARACREDLSAATCAEPIPPGIAAVHEDGRLALVSPPWLEGCGAPRVYRAFEALAPALRTDEPEVFGPDADAARAALRWLGVRLRRGFAPVEDLLAASCEYEAWRHPARSLGALQGPLEGWLLRSGRGRKAITFELVPPANRDPLLLESLALTPGKTCDDDEDHPGRCRDELGAEVLQAVLTPSRRTLALTVLLSAGGPCAGGRVLHLAQRLPDAAVEAIRKRDRQQQRVLDGPAPVSPDLLPPGPGP